MSLTTIGNCRNYWRFESSELSGGEFTDSVNGVAAVLDGTAAWATQNSLEGLDLATNTAVLQIDDSDVLGEFSVICVTGYRGGGQSYGLATQNVGTTPVKAILTCSSNKPTYANETFVATGDSPMNQSAVNVVCLGSDLENGLFYIQVDGATKYTSTGNKPGQSTLISSKFVWGSNGLGGTKDPLQHLYELAFYIGDVTQDPGYATEIAALKTKYGI